MSFPRILIHNFRLRPPMPPGQIRALAGRDLVILSPIFRNDYQDIAEIRRLNPKIVILQYALTYQVAWDDNAPLGNEEEAAIFRDSPESWLTTASVAVVAKPVAPGDRRIALSKSLPAAFTRRFLPVILCGAELMRVEHMEGNEVQVLRGVLGTARQGHAAGAPVAIVTQPPSWTVYQRSVTPASEVININISDRAPRIGGIQPWRMKADFLAGRWADPQWRQAFDGFFLDEGQAEVNPNLIDLNRDGAADTPDEVYAAMRRGQCLLAKRLRELCGDELVMVFNNQNTIIPGASGRHREHFVDMAPPEHSADWVSQFQNWAFSMEPFHAWSELAHQPAFVLNTSQPGSWTDFRQMRFGLASALLYGGYFQYRAQSGDAGNWRHWFDEYAAQGRNWLGKPLGPARQIVQPLESENRMKAGNWEVRLGSPAAAAADVDEQGDAIRVEIRRLKVPRPGVVSLTAAGKGSLLPGTEYTLALDARPSSPRLIDVTIRVRGRVRAISSIYLQAGWNRHVLTLYIPPGEALPEFALSFELGRDEGWIEFDNISLRDGVAETGWIREFEHGMAVVNPTRRPQVLRIPPGFRKLKGAQDPRHNDGAGVQATLQVPPLDAYLLIRKHE
ncbi:MAG: putative glycoside hydrolase family 15 protein [Acidobacteria bacterium]|nr:putative glycoside hydrolase family 15 protein [Acidobacteriota bacterium]